MRRRVTNAGQCRFVKPVRPHPESPSANLASCRASACRAALVSSFLRNKADVGHYSDNVAFWLLSTYLVPGTVLGTK